MVNRFWQVFQQLQWPQARALLHLERLTPFASGQLVESTSDFAGARQASPVGSPCDARQAVQAGAPSDARQAVQAGAPFDARQAGRDETLPDARQADRDGAFLDARQAGQDGAFLDARQAGQDGENLNKGSSGDTRGWAKGWGRKEGLWVRGDWSLVHKKANDMPGLRGNEANCRNGDTARKGGDPGHRGFQPTNDCHPIVELEANLEGRQEGVASLKHMRSEVAFESGACRWFPILSPSKRPMHHNGVITVVPRAVSTTPELLLLSIQTDRW